MKPFLINFSGIFVSMQTIRQLNEEEVSQTTAVTKVTALCTLDTTINTSNTVSHISEPFFDFESGGSSFAIQINLTHCLDCDDPSVRAVPMTID